MERENNRPSPAEASDTLTTLAADRDRLSSVIRIPWVLMTALGALAAWWVAAAALTRPGEDYEAPTSGWLAFVGALVIAHLIRRETGIRFRTMGAAAVWATVGIIAACLTLFSISLGFVSFGATWAVLFTSVAAFGITTWLSGVALRSGIKKLRDE